MLTILPLPDSCERRAPVVLAPRRRLCRRCLTRPASFARRYGGQCHHCHVTDPARPRCRHCGTNPAMRGKSRYRGLCRACFIRPDVRDLYPPESKFAARNFGNVNRKSRLPAEPTVAAPGSEAKILVMMARCARRECLFRPADGPA